MTNQSELYDFYYSPTQARILGGDHCLNYVQGKPFTEATKTGEPPSSNMKDWQVVFTNLPYDENTVVINPVRVERINKATGGQRRYAELDNNYLHYGNLKQMLKEVWNNNSK